MLFRSRAKDVLLEAIESFSGTVIFVSHDRYFLDRLATKVLEVKDGGVVIYPGNFAEFVRDKVGTFDTELVREWFNAFAINAGVTLHVETLYGENSHHIAESCFKGLARALRAAVAIDPRAAGEVPSTKGQLGG